MRKLQRTVKSLGIGNVQFQQADIFNLAFEPESYDHIFVCFVLEHSRARLTRSSFLKAFSKVAAP